MSKLTIWLKHIIKVIIHYPDLHWETLLFEHSISKRTLNNYSNILNWADNLAAKENTLTKFANSQKLSTDPIVIQGMQLREKVMREFDGIFSKSKIRILIHVPNEIISPGGYSLFTNMAEALNFIGIKTSIMKWDEPIAPLLARDNPNVFMTSDAKSYLDKIDWEEIHRYKQNHKLFIGLTASLEEYGNSPLKERLDWAKKNGVDFYYSYREQNYIKEKLEYKPFFDAGYKIFSIPFGANPLVYYPIDLNQLNEVKKDLDYVFLASRNRTKANRYYPYLKKIISKYSGFIGGPGWNHCPNFIFNKNRDRYIYARAKVGLNISIDEQIKYANEVNERTYQLAACGVPQLTDHAKLLDIIFSKDALFIANSPKEYVNKFNYIIANPKEAERKALIAQREVFGKYTTFHRAADFITMLNANFNIN